MEVVPTNDGDDDDGVIWYRCPQCQGFLPKLKGALEAEEAPEEATATPSPAEKDEKDESLRWDSPAAMMQELKDSSAGDADSVDGGPDLLESDDDVLVGTVPADEPEPIPETVVEPVVKAAAGPEDVFAEPDSKSQKNKKSADKDEPAKDVEPILEYAAMLAESDVSEVVPYRPWDVYEVGQCINHLAWNDCGVVVAKESIPGGRKIIKCYFEGAGVVRLIEQAPR